MGRNVIVMISAVYQWSLFAAVVKSAFSQADPVAKTVTDYRDMQRILGMDADTYVLLVKPMFGDPMAARFWNGKLVHELKIDGMRQDPLAKFIWYTGGQMRQVGRHSRRPC